MQLGITVKDRITGFSGIVTGFVQYITGCNQALVAPPLSSTGDLRSSEWFDIQRLEIDETAETIVLDNGATPGCDRAPPRR